MPSPVATECGSTEEVTSFRPRRRGGRWLGLRQRAYEQSPLGVEERRIVVKMAPRRRGRTQFASGMRLLARLQVGVHALHHLATVPFRAWQ